MNIPKYNRDKTIIIVASRKYYVDTLKYFPAIDQYTITYSTRYIQDETYFNLCNPVVQMALDTLRSQWKEYIPCKLLSHIK